MAGARRSKAIPSLIGIVAMVLHGAPRRLRGYCNLRKPCRSLTPSKAWDRTVLAPQPTWTRQGLLISFPDCAPIKA